jgi:hypothetical protein
MSLVVLDTDVASFSLRNRLPDQLRAALAAHTMCIAFIGSYGSGSSLTPSTAQRPARHSSVL